GRSCSACPSTSKSTRTRPKPSTTFRYAPSRAVTLPHRSARSGGCTPPNDTRTSPPGRRSSPLPAAHVGPSSRVPPPRGGSQPSAAGGLAAVARGDERQVEQAQAGRRRGSGEIGRAGEGHVHVRRDPVGGLGGGTGIPGPAAARYHRGHQHRREKPAPGAPGG